MRLWGDFGEGSARDECRVLAAGRLGWLGAAVIESAAAAVSPSLTWWVGGGAARAAGLLAWAAHSRSELSVL